MDIKELAPLVLIKRGNMGVRAAAREIGISPTTLTRIEKKNIPDVETLNKVCTWLGEDTARFTGIGGLQIAFKSINATPPKTAKSLAKLIEKASKQFVNERKSVGH